MEKDPTAPCNSLSRFRLSLTGLCRDGSPQSQRSRLLRPAHRRPRLRYLACLKQLPMHPSWKQPRPLTTRGVKLFGTKWMENGNGGRVTRPTTRAQDLASPGTEISNRRPLSWWTVFGPTRLSVKRGKLILKTRCGSRESHPKTKSD